MKDQKVSFRVSKDIKNELKSKANELSISLSELITNIINSKDINIEYIINKSQDQLSKNIERTNFLIYKISNNINQLARLENNKSMLNNESELKAEQLSLINDQLLRIQEMIASYK